MPYVMYISLFVSNGCYLFICLFIYPFIYPPIYLFIMVLHHFHHPTGHITMGSLKGRGNQYIQLVKVLYCKLPTNSRQLPSFPLEVRIVTKLQSQIWEARVLPLCHHGPLQCIINCHLCKYISRRNCVSVSIFSWLLNGM